MVTISLSDELSFFRDSSSVGPLVGLTVAVRGLHGLQLNAGATAGGARRGGRGGGGGGGGDLRSTAMAAAAAVAMASSLIPRHGSSLSRPQRRKKR